MKYLKVFETKILDDILDKISEEGETSLNSWERKYLSSYDDVHTRTKLEAEKEREENPSKEFEEPVDDIETIDNDDLDDYIIDDQVSILWEIIDTDVVNEFFDKFDIGGYDKYSTTRWNDLPKELQNAFKTYLKQKGHIK